VLFALFIGILFVFAQQADAAKGPIITNKVCDRERSIVLTGADGPGLL
jgi:hypothetical protein